MGAPVSLEAGFAKWIADFAGLRKLFCEMLAEGGDPALTA